MKIIFIVILCLFNINAGVYSTGLNQNLFFRYGIMYGGKSTEIVQRVQNEGRDNIFLITANITQNNKENPVVHARDIVDIGDISVDYSFSESSDFAKLFGQDLNRKTKVFIDEGQFLTVAQIATISAFCKKNPQIIICIYGLMDDCFGQKFPSSESLETIADKVEEVESKAICPCCETKAICTVRINKDNYVVETSGAQIATTAQGFLYISVCKKHKCGDLSEFSGKIMLTCSK